MTLAQVIVVGLVWKRDASPRNFKRACSPSERTGIEDGRNRNFRGYLRDREISWSRPNRICPTSPNHLLWAASACSIPVGVRSASAGTIVQRKTLYYDVDTLTPPNERAVPIQLGPVAREAVRGVDSFVELLPHSSHACREVELGRRSPQISDAHRRAVFRFCNVVCGLTR